MRKRPASKFKDEALSEAIIEKMEEFTPVTKAMDDYHLNIMVSEIIDLVRGNNES